MNIKRFVGRNAREAIAQARAAWGDQTVVLSNRPIPGGVEILAMAGAEVPDPAPASPAAPPAGESAPAGMSTLSFQQFVRERQRRDADLANPPRPPAPAAAATPAAAAGPAVPAMRPLQPAAFAQQALREEMQAREAMPAPARAPAPGTRAAAAPQDNLMSELRSMSGMIASQLASMSWFDSVRRSPAQTRLLRLMIGNGFSPALARSVVHRLPAECSEARADMWLLEALSRNLGCAGQDAIGQRGGVIALVGPTGVGKTTTCAKMAAHFSRLHGPASVGLVSVDTYRIGAGDQLRTYGQLLGIPVHTARDGASLAELLDLLGKKKLVLIDTVGVGQRDPRLAELFAALPAGRLERLLVLNASAQAETLEETVLAYGQPGMRCAITKLDEAVTCGGVVDVAIRHHLVVDGIATGQRVPEDWHAPRAQLLVQKALMKRAPSVFTHGDDELALMLTAPAGAQSPRQVPRA